LKRSIQLKGCIDSVALARKPNVHNGQIDFLLCSDFDCVLSRCHDRCDRKTCILQEAFHLIGDEKVIFDN
jgi:hypothetical protein